jgi:hypothetical protein
MNFARTSSPLNHGGTDHARQAHRPSPHRTVLPRRRRERPATRQRAGVGVAAGRFLAARMGGTHMIQFRAPQPRDAARIAGFPWPAGAAVTPVTAAPSNSRADAA